MNRSIKYFCIFGGGAVRGYSYIGALQALKENNIELVGYAGSSAGAIFATAAALDYSIDEMREFFNGFNLMLFRDINFSFKLELAFSKGEIFTDKIREIISNKIQSDKPVTFKDFPKPLYIITSNLSNGESFIFSKETTPDFEVAEAVRISSSFPGLMTPYEYEGNYYVDGDLAKACALSKISPLLSPKNVRVLEFRLEGMSPQTEDTNPVEFINNSYDFVCSNATKNVIKLYQDKDNYDYIVIETKNTRLYDLTLSNEKKEELIKLGYNKTNEFFEFKLCDKKKKLCKSYTKMNKCIKESIKFVVSNDYDKLKDILYSYVSENYFDFENFDREVVGILNDCINTVKQSRSKVLFLKAGILNKVSLKEKLDKLKERLDNRIFGLASYISKQR